MKSKEITNLLVGSASFCDYPTIQGAVDALEQMPAGPAEITILSGVYYENVQINRSDIVVRGIGEVEIRAGRYARQLDAPGREIGTFATATLVICGRNVLIDNLTITNDAGQGEEVGQALAVYAYCDETVFRSCTLKGHQDTLFTGPLPPATKHGLPFEGFPHPHEHEHYRQLYLNCRIEGTVDFIFGGATAYFHRCELVSLRRGSEGPGYITAASTPEEAGDGYVFNECYLTAEEGAGEVYLGRPWRSFAKTDFANCRMEGHIHPLGWDNWGKPGNERTARYREFGVNNAADLPGQRVPWAICTEKTDDSLRMERVFAGTDFWQSYLRD